MASFLSCFPWYPQHHEANSTLQTCVLLGWMKRVEEWKRMLPEREIKDMKSKGKRQFLWLWDKRFRVCLEHKNVWQGTGAIGVSHISQDCLTRDYSLLRLLKNSTLWYSKVYMIWTFPQNNPKVQNIEIMESNSKISDHTGWPPHRHRGVAALRHLLWQMNISHLLPENLCGRNGKQTIIICHAVWVLLCFAPPWRKNWWYLFWSLVDHSQANVPEDLMEILWLNEGQTKR